MDKKILLLLFLVSGFAFSQTTVTLQDQCNCEVLSGTAVTSPGTTTPSGADTGDIYVNTNTGVIYFWDGDSWELTSSDDQLLQNFSFNSGTNILSLDIEDGNTVNVDLSSLSGTGTDDQLISLAGNILTLEDGGAIDLSSYIDNTDDQIITAFSIDASNILTLTLEDGNTQTVDLSGLVGTDDQTAAEVTYDNTASGLTATDVQDAIDEINAAAGTVAMVDNGDGTYDFTDAGGNTTTISDTSISTMVDNADGTYTYTDETGATQTIDTNASSNPYDNTVSGLTATDVQAAIDEINALAGTVAMVDNGDGTYDFTDTAGNTTTISDTSISTMVDNADGTYTYTDETGATQLIDTNASSNPYDNTASGLTATDVQAAIDEINAAAGTVALVDNGDGTYDFTDAGGNTTIITDTSISTLVDNADGTYTYTDESGATQLIDTNASSNPYDNTVSGLTALNVQDAIDEINAAAGTVALVDNGDGTYDFTDALGNTTTISDTSISTMVDNADGTYTYTDESGATQIIDTNASSNPYDNTVSGLTATDVQAAIDEINAAAGTVAMVDNGDGTYDFTDAAGNTTTISDTSISTLVDNADGTYTYTDETGATQLIDTNASSNPYDNTASGLTATDVQAAIDEINAAAGTVALVDNGDGTYDFTDALGNTTTISDTSISTMVDNADGTYTYTDETGATQLIDTNASSNPYDNTASGLTATDVQAAIDEINAAAGTVALVDNGDGTYDFTDAGGNTTIITDTSISTLVDNADGTYTYTDESGATQLIDTNASSNPYDNTASGLTATDVQAAIDEINALAGTVALVDNGDGTYDFTDAAGNTTIISDTSISTLVDNGDGSFTYTDETGATTIFTETLTTLVDNFNGTFTYTNEDGVAQIVSKSDIIDNFDGTYVFNNNDGSPETIDTRAISNPYDNTTSGLTATDVQAAIDEINALAGTVALVDNGDGTYDFTDAAGNTTIITDTSISTLVDNADGTYTYTDESGATQTIDTNASSNPYDNTTSGLTATDVQAALDELAAGSTDDQNISGSGLAGTDLTIGIENGASEVVDLSSLVESVIAGTGAITVTDDGNGNYTVNSTDPDEDLTNELTLLGSGAPVVVPSNAGVTYVDTVAGQLYVWDGAVWNVVGGNASPDLDGDPANELNTAFAVNAGNLEITDNGGTLTVPLASLGTDDQTAAEVTYDNTASGLTAIDVQAAIDELDAAAGNVALVDNLDGTYTFTDAGGNNTTISDTSISTMVDNADGTYTYTDETGATQNIDTNANSNPYDNTVSGLVATDVQAAIDELEAGSTDDQNISGSGLAGTNLTIGIENGASELVDLSSLVGTDDQNISGSGLAGTNLTIAIENGASEIVDLSSLVETVVAGTGAITVTDDGNGNYTVNSTDPDEDLTNELTLIGAGAPAVVPSNSGVTYVDSVAGQLYIWDGVAWNAVGGNASPDLDGDPTNEQNTAFAINAGNLEITDSGGTLSVPLASLGTDDQNIESLAVDAGTNILTVGIEDGTSQTVDLSHLDDAGTDDQTAAEVTYDNTTSGLTATEVQAAIDELEAGSTDDQNISGSGLAGTNLTIGIENGASELVDLSSLVGTDDQNISGSGLAGTNLTIAIENGASEVVDLSSLVGSDDQNIESLAVDVGTNILTVGIEDGVSQTVDLSHLDDAGTDDQNITGSGLAGNILTIGIENGTNETVDLSALVGTDDQTAAEVTYDNTTSGLTATEVQAAIDEVAAGSTDDQNIESLAVDAGTNILTVGIEDGTSQTVDLSHLDDAGTDDQTAAEVTYDNTTSGLTATEVQAALDEVAAGSTDDQNITGSGLAGTDLTIGIENGTNEVVDLSSLVETVIAGTGAITVTDDGNGNYTVNSTDPDEDLTNELTLIGAGAPVVVPSNAGVTYVDSVAGQLYIWDGAVWNAVGGSASPDLDGDPTNERNTAFAVNAGNLDITDSGGTLSVPLTSLGTDDQNIESLAVDAGTNILTVGIEDGTSQTVDLSHLDDAGTDDQTAAEVTYDNTISGLTAIDVKAALDELATGSTDDQNISGSGLVGTNLTIGIESGASEVVDLSSLVGTDDQAISLVGNTLTLEDGGTVDLAPYLDNTDDQNISGSGLVGTNLTIGIESGASEVVDLSSLVGTDDQNIESLAVDAGTNILTVGIEDGTSQTVDLSHLDDAGTDDQTAAEVTYDNTISGLTAIDVKAALDELATGSTDDQNISGSGLVGTNLTIGIESGASEVVDLSSLVGTDDQAISLVGNTLTLEDGGTVDLAPYLDNTDDQNISGSGLVGTNLTIGIESGASEVVDLSSLVGTDDQNIESLAVDAGTNILTVGIEDGTSQTVDLSHLDDAGTDDQTAAEVTYDNTISGLTAIDVKAALDELATGSTDDQNISGSGLVGTNLTIGIESGASEVVDLSSLVGTDDQAISLVGNTLTLEDGGTVDLAPYLDNTDDQNISGSGLVGTNLTIGIESGASEVVDLSSLVGTDDQNIESLAVDAGTNILTVGIEDGTSQTVDLSHLDDAGTDDQTAAEVTYDNTISGLTAIDVKAALDELATGSTDDQNISGSGLVGTNLTIGIESGASEVVDLSSLVGTDDQAISLVGNTLTLEDGGTVDLAPYLDNTDDQNISGSGLVGTNLTIGIESGASEVVDLSSLVGSDDQNIESLAVDAGTNILTVGIEDGTSQTVDLSHLDDAGTDDQNITGSGLAGNILTIGIENGTNETVDLSALVGTDDQNLTGASLSVANVLQIDIENGGSTTVDLSSLDDSGTDDQNISGSGLVGTNLTIGIESGASEVVDLSSLVGTDDQNIESLAVDAGTNILTVGIEDGTSQTVDLSHLDDAGTDDQYDDEVLLRTPIDVDEGGVGSPTNETTVEEVIQAIAPITSKAARIFYPPSIAVDASTNGSFSIDLYAQYTAQFGTPTVASAGAPAAVPTYAATELYYYVTYADPTVFNTATMAIDGNGVLSYDIIGQPSDYNSLINVVFVVK